MTEAPISHPCVERLVELLTQGLPQAYRAVEKMDLELPPLNRIKVFITTDQVEYLASRQQDGPFFEGLLELLARIYRGPNQLEISELIMTAHKLGVYIGLDTNDASRPTA